MDRKFEATLRETSAEREDDDDAADSWVDISSVGSLGTSDAEELTAAPACGDSPASESEGDAAQEFIARNKNTPRTTEVALPQPEATKGTKWSRFFRRMRETVFGLVHRSRSFILHLASPTMAAAENCEKLSAWLTPSLWRNVMVGGSFAVTLIACVSVVWQNVPLIKSWAHRVGMTSN